MLLDIPMWHVHAYHQTGSSVICNPPVVDTDIDYVIFVYRSSFEEHIKIKLLNSGWKLCGNEAYDDQDNTFISYRKGKLNYIFVFYQGDYDRWEAAMLLAKDRNLVSKQDRINLFRTILAGTKKKTAGNATYFDLTPSP